jgi:hypothetical protein
LEEGKKEERNEWGEILTGEWSNSDEGMSKSRE